jgi:predicted N-acyltransferase
MPYSYQLYSSVDAVDSREWDAVQQRDASPLTDLRLLRVFEQTLQEQSQCWPLIIRDEQGRAAAVTSLSLFRVDGGILAGPVIRWVTARMRRVRPQFLRLPMLIGGVPISTGECAIAFREDADRPAVVQTLIKALDEAQQRLRPKLTIVNEFTDEQADELAGLQQAGFLRVPSLPMNEFPPGCTDFEDYLQRRSSRSRHNIRKSRRKLETGGITVQHLRGSDGAARHLTDDVQRLYDAVYEKSDTKFEYLPLEFFRELARQMPEEAWYTYLFKDGRVVAFSLRIAYRGHVYLIRLGVDYDLNRDYDLYFNALYEDLDFALEHQATAIHFGQNSSPVKLRIGCRQSARWLFVKGHGVFGPLIRKFSRYIFREVDVQSAEIEQHTSPQPV